MNKSYNFNANPDNINEIRHYWKSWSIVRNEYQRIAWEAYRSGDNEKAVLYDSKVLSCGFIGGLLNDDQQHCLRNIRPTTNIDDNSNRSVDSQPNAENELIHYLSDCISDVIIGKTEKPNSPVEIDDKTQFKELCSKLSQLPKQWSVVQFSQFYSGYNGFATTKDLYVSDAPIKITLLCDSLSEERDNHPISVVLDFNELGEKSVRFF